MKIAFCKILSQFASGFMLDLGGVVGYIDEIQHKIRCKMGRKIVGMNFQTRSSAAAPPCYLGDPSPQASQYKKIATLCFFCI